MRVGHYFQHRKRWWLRLHEKGGKRYEVPCHPSLEVHLNDWIEATGIAGEKQKPLFRCVHKGDNLTGNAMIRFDIFQASSLTSLTYRRRRCSSWRIRRRVRLWALRATQRRGKSGIKRGRSLPTMKRYWPGIKSSRANLRFCLRSIY